MIFHGQLHETICPKNRKESKLYSMKDHFKERIGFYFFYLPSHRKFSQFDRLHMKEIKDFDRKLTPEIASHLFGQTE